MDRAREALAAGRPEQAVHLFTEALSQPAVGQAERVELLIARSEAHLLCKDAAAARADADKVLGGAAACGRAWLLKACALHAEDDDLRAEAHASCALQLEPALQGSPLYEPWMRRVSWVYLEASEVDGLGSDFTRLDKAVCYQKGAVLVLGPGMHHGSTFMVTRRTALIGSGRPGEVKLVDKRRMFASSDTVCVDSQPGGLTLLENLHISCSQDHAQLVAAGRVAVHACTFTRTGGSNRPAVSAVGGQLSMADCTIDGNTSGGVMAAMSGTVLLRRCTVRNCHKNGVEACMGGSLQAEDVTSHNNLQGCLVRDAAGPVRLTQCTFFNNQHEGVTMASNKSSELLLRSCQIYQNGTFGLSFDEGSAGRAVDCRVHGNGFWAIIIKSVSDADLQGCEVFGNKCGGVYLGLNGKGVVRLTHCWIHHNRGKGFHDISRDDPLAPSMQRNRQVAATARAMGWQMDSHKPEMSGNRIEENEERHGHPARLADSEKRCELCQVVQADGQKLMQCSGCRLVRYCSAEHQLVSQGQEVVVEVHPLFASLPGGSGHVVQITHPLVKVRRNAKTPEEKGGNIVVKIQTTEYDINPSQFLGVYDSSRTLNGNIRSPALFNLVMEQGVMGANGFTSNKFNAYARVEEGGKKLRVLTHQLAPLQSW